MQGTRFPEGPGGARAGLMPVWHLGPCTVGQGEWHIPLSCFHTESQFSQPGPLRFIHVTHHSLGPFVTKAASLELSSFCLAILVASGNLFINTHIQRPFLAPHHPAAEPPAPPASGPSWPPACYRPCSPRLSCPTLGRPKPCWWLSDLSPFTAFTRGSTSLSRTRPACPVSSWPCTGASAPLPSWLSSPRPLLWVERTLQQDKLKFKPMVASYGHGVSADAIEVRPLG